MRFDTLLPPFRNFRQFLIGSETGGYIHKTRTNIFVFPTKVSFEYGVLNSRKSNTSLSVANNSKRKYLNFRDLFKIEKNINKLPSFITDISGVEPVAITYFRFGKPYMHIYDSKFTSRVALPLDSLPAYSQCIDLLVDKNEKIKCLLGKAVVNLRQRKFYVFVTTKEGNFLHVYKF